MALSSAQSSQLEAFRQLLTDEFLLNGFLSQGLENSLSPSNARTASKGRITKQKAPQKSGSGMSRRVAETSKASPLERASSSLSHSSTAESSVHSDWVQDTPPRRAAARSKKAAATNNASPLQRPAARISNAPHGTASNYQNRADFEFLSSIPNRELQRFVVGLDYGTTFTSVSYFSHPMDEENPRAFPSDIKSIMNWPEDGMGGIRRQLPTESWYPSTPRDRLLRIDPLEFDDDENQENQEPIGQATSSIGLVEIGPLHQLNGVIDPRLDDNLSPAYLWGYEVPYQIYRANTTRDENRHIERPKLMLVNSTHTKEDRERLRPRLDNLVKMGIIRKHGKNEPDARDVQDVITDFLVEVFKHTMQQLVQNEGFSKECPVSFVLTVPVIWSPKSSRVLQNAVEEAIEATGFGTLGHGSVDNLFIITEPEAAATYLLGSSHDMLAGETFVVLDCGGGTVDGVTYTVANGYPLRLKAEVGRPTGDNCGASYLNDNFERLLLEQLADETYLERNGEIRESIVRHLVPTFEDYDKRSKDITKRPGGRFKVPGLLGDQQRDLTGANAKRFDNNHILLNAEDYNRIFVPLLQRVSKVLKEQIEVAMSKGKQVKKVFLIGGFGAAPSLRSFLRRFLVDFTRELKLPYEISLITTNEQDSVTAVASGAVLRALNKDHGPTRMAYSSYGFLRVEPYQPKISEGHRASKPMRDEVDGEDYLTVIDYFMVKNLKGTLVPPVHYYKPFKTYHTFEVDNPRFLCEEVLYVSDLATDSHYPLNHPKNKDAQIAGKIIVDMTRLRDEGIILPIFPVPDEDREMRGKVHYKVEYDLVAIVEGRNLRYEARYPANHLGQVQKTGQISIAAAFKPGTG